MMDNNQQRQQQQKNGQPRSLEDLLTLAFEFSYERRVHSIKPLEGMNFFRVEYETLERAEDGTAGVSADIITISAVHALTLISKYFEGVKA